MSNINDNKRLWHLLNPDVGIGTTAWRAHLDTLGFTGHSIVDDTKAMLLDGGYWTGNINESLSNYYSPELLVNGNFCTGDLTGWTIEGTPSGGNIVEVVDNKLHVVTDGIFLGVSQTAVEVGKTYIVSFDVISVDTSFAVLLGPATNVIISSAGYMELLIVATGTDLQVVRDFATGAVDFTVDNLSVKETI